MSAKETVLAIEVKVDSATHLHERLNAAVETARQKAIKHGKHGILVTQYGYGNFMVAISPEVPYGLTLERRLLPPRNSNPAMDNRQTTGIAHHRPQDQKSSPIRQG